MTLRPTQLVETRRQRGAALLIMLLVLILGAAALFARNLSDAGALARQEARATVLAEAREALLGALLIHDQSASGQLGFLPCPDTGNGGGFDEGVAHTSACGSLYQSRIGRLPWRTLGISPARGSYGECLWYAVSGNWKSAGASSPAALNTDSSGEFRILGADGSTVLAGATPGERAVAVIFYPGSLLTGQSRNPLASGVDQCGGNFTAANYLDDDAASGISNATLTTTPDANDDFIAGQAGSPSVNDQLIFITRADIEQRLLARSDVRTRLDNLTLAVTKCIADYGRRNPGGAADRRLPWPAPVDLLEYRSANQYDDTPIGWLSGRVPDRVNDSNGLTGNTTARILTNCSSATVPEWTPAMAAFWQHWKDHLFYAVSGSFAPSATAPTSCASCVTVNGGASRAAIVMWSGQRLAALGQTRDEPPQDADTRGNIANYLEGRNATNQPNAGGNGNYQSQVAGTAFNDILYCIDPNMNVGVC